MALTKLNFGGNQQALVAANIPTLNSTSMPVGSIVQTLQSLNSYQFATSSTSFVDLESASGVVWATSITPSSSSNKVLIIPSIHIRSLDSDAHSARFALTIQSQIASGSPSTIFNTSVTQGRLGGYDYGGSGLQIGSYYNQIFLYSPNTTNEVKIRFQIRASGSGVTVEHNSDDYDSLCVLQEVKG